MGKQTKPQEERKKTTMTTENVTIETVTAPKMSLNEKSLVRIAYEERALAAKQARLPGLKEGTPAHAKCVASIAKTESLLADIKSKLAARQAKAAEKLQSAPANDAAPAEEIVIEVDEAV